MHNTENFTVKLDKIRKSAELYYKGHDPILSDKEYDLLVREVQEEVNVNPDLQKLVGATLSSVGFGSDSGDTKHARKMLSLDNVFDNKTLTKWAKSAGSSVFSIEPKLDGLSIALTYKNGNLTKIVTRGDGVSGDNVSYCGERMINIPKSISETREIEVRGEVVFTSENYKIANENRIKSGKPAYANPRNASAGAVRAESLDYEVKLEFYAHSVHGLIAETHSELMALLQKLGFATCIEKGFVVTSIESMIGSVNTINQERWSYPYEIDGAVIKVNEIAAQSRLGETSKSPKWAIAYKYAAAEVYGVLAAIDNQVGRLGTITPVGKLASPVEVNGVKIESVTLHNFKEIQRKDIRIGDTVIVRRAGEVIPEIVGVVFSLRDPSAKPYVSPTNCPSCGSALDMSEIKYKCVSQTCGLSQYLAYVGSRKILDIQGLGEVNATKLVKAGLVENITDLYQLTLDQIRSLPGLGDKSGENLINEIEKSKKLPLQNFVSALGLPLIGPVVSNKLVKEFKTLDRLLNAEYENLVKIPGIGEEIAREFLKNKKYTKESLVKLKTLGCELPSLLAKESASASLKNKTFVVTGSFENYTRETMKSYINSHGGECKDAVTSKTNYLLIGDKPSSSKVSKAEKLNIPVVQLDFLQELIST
jgi:DNA ligase (NAD+)